MIHWGTDVGIVNLAVTILIYRVATHLLAFDALGDAATLSAWIGSRDGEYARCDSRRNDKGRLGAGSGSDRCWHATHGDPKIRRAKAVSGNDGALPDRRTDGGNGLNLRSRRPDRGREERETEGYDCKNTNNE
jgi:hypothetical protein